MHVSEKALVIIANVIKYCDQCLVSENRYPTDREICQYLKIKSETLKGARQQYNLALVLSLEDHISLGDDDNDQKLCDVLTNRDADDKIDKFLTRDYIIYILRFATPRQRKAITIYLGLKDGRKKTVREVGELMGVGHQNVSLLVRDGLKKIRKALKQKS